MADESVGIKFQINGGEQAVKGIKDIVNALKLFQERLQTNELGLDNWGTAATKTEQIQETLRSKIELLKGAIAENNEELEKWKDAEGNVQKKGLFLQRQNEEFNRDLQQTEKALSAVDSGLVDTTSFIERAESRIKSIDSEVKKATLTLNKNQYSIDALNNKKTLLIKRLQEERHVQDLSTIALNDAETAYGKNTKELNEYKDALDRANDAVDRTETEIEDLNKEINTLSYRKAADGLNQISTFANAMGRAFQFASTAAATALKTSVSSAISFESAFAGVKKTADDTEVGFYGLQKVFKDTTTTFDEFVSQVESGNPKAQEAISAGYNKIKKDLESLATVTASSVEEIMQVAEYAGQLGIPASQIKDFTEVVIKMGDSTSYGTEEAALSLARLGNVLMDEGLSTKQAAAWYNKLGSVIVDLGNNAAALEPEIGNVLQRISAVGKQSKFTTAELAALSTALVSTGIKQEAGGTALMNTISQIEKAVAGGKESLEYFAEVAGMTAQQFGVVWKTEPMKGMEAFLKGLQKLSNGTIKTSSEIDKEVKKSSKSITKSLEDIAKIAGMTGEEFRAAWKEDKVEALRKYQEGLEKVDLAEENAITMLDALGIKSKRQTQAVLSLAASEADLEVYLERANKEWEKGAALNTEANKRYETLETAISQMSEAWKILSSVLGESFAPVIRATAEAMKDIALVLTDLPKPIIAVGTAFLGIVAAISPAMFIVAQFIESLQSLESIAIEGSAFSGIAQKLLKPFNDIPIKVADIGVKVQNSLKKDVVEKAAEEVTKGSSLMSKAVEWLMSPFKNIGSYLKEAFGGFGKEIGNIIKTFGSKFGTIFKDIFSVFPTMFSTFAAEFSAIFKELSDVKVIGTIINFFKSFATILGTVGGTVAPVLAAVGAVSLLVGAFVKLSGSDNPVDAAKAKIDEFTQNLPIAFANVVGKIQVVIAEIGQKAGKVVESIVKGLTETMPELIKIGADIITYLVDAIVDNLPQLIELAGLLLETLVDAIIENLPKILGAAVQIVGALAKGLIKSMPDIVNAAGKLLAALLKALASGLGSLAKAGTNLAKSAWDAIANAWKNAKDLAANLIKGLIEGVGAWKDKLIQKVKDTVDAVKDWITGKNGFDENSPSKWAKEVGRYVDEGLAIGMEEGVQTLASTSKKVVQTVEKVIANLPKTYFKLGKKSGKGLGKGIKNGMKTVTKNVKSLVTATSNSLKVANGNFTEAGKDAVANFKLGMNTLKKSVINDFSNTVTKVVNAVSTKKNKTKFQKAGTALIKAFKESITAETTSLIKEATDAINKIAAEANAAYEAVVKKQEELYAKLSDVSSLFQDDRLPTLTALRNETELVTKYGEQLTLLKDKIPDTLMQQLLSMDIESAVRYTSSLLSMSEEQFAEYVKAVEDLESASDIASAKFYEQDLLDIEKQFKKDVDAAMKKLSTDAESFGSDVIKGFVKGMASNTGALEEPAKDLARTVTTTLKKELKIKSPSKVAYKIGANFVDGFYNALSKYGEVTIGDGTEELAEVITDSLVEELDSTNNTISKKINSDIKALTKNTNTKIRTTINSIADTTLTYTNQVSSKLINNITNSITSAIGTGIDSIADLATSSLTSMLGNYLTELIPDTGNALMNTVLKILTGMGNSFIGTLIGGFATDIKDGISSLFGNITSSLKTGLDDLKFAIRDGFSRYVAKDAYADSYYFGESMMVGISDGIKDSKNKAIDSALKGALSTFDAVEEARNKSISKALSLNNNIVSNAQNVVNTFIDYDRLADIIGDRNIYLGERQVGRELRNMGVQFV